MRVNVPVRLDEKLDKYWQDELDRLNDKSKKGQTTEEEEARIVVLSKLSKDNREYAKTKKDANDIRKYVNQILDDDDSEVEPATSDTIDRFKKNNPSTKKSVYDFADDLEAQRKKAPVFVDAVSDCLEEISPNSLYWLCVEFNKASSGEKQEVVDNFLRDYSSVVSRKNRYDNVRALLMNKSYVSMYIKLFKPYAGSRVSTAEPPTQLTGDSQNTDNQEKPKKGEKKSGKKSSEKENSGEDAGDEEQQQDAEDDKEDKSTDKETYIYQGDNPVKAGAEKYTKLVIQKVAVIGANAFSGMKNVKKIVWYDKKERKTGLFRTGDTSQRVYEDSLPPSVQHIRDFAFNGCSSLTNLNLPDSVRTIGSKAFSGCKNLHKLKIGKSAEQVSRDAFAGCGGGSLEIQVSAYSKFYDKVEEMIKNGQIKSIQDYFKTKGTVGNISIVIIDKQEKKKLDNKIKRLMNAKR